MNVSLDKLPTDAQGLKEIIGKLYLENQKYLVENYQLQDQLSLLKKLIFGSKSEKFNSKDGKQQLLFNEVEETTKTKEPILKVEVKGYTRSIKKRKKTIPDDFPRNVVICDIDEKDKLCACGAEKKYIGHDTLEEIEIKPAVLKVTEFKKLKYACLICEGTEEEEKSPVITGEYPLKLLPGTMVTSSLLAEFTLNKYCYGLPIYRQCTMFAHLGFNFHRGTICNWLISAHQKMEALDKLIKSKVTESSVLHIDETVVQVLKELGKTAQSNSYMWVFVGGSTDHPLIYYDYSPSRSATILDEYLENYKGIIVSDDYSGYNSAQKKYLFSHAGCNAHTRRKFIEEFERHKNPDAKYYLEFYSKLYRIEEIIRKRKFSLEKISKIRKNYSSKIMHEMKVWLDEKSTTVVPLSGLGKAISHSLKNWKKITLFLTNPIIPIDNNIAENKIRPFVIGRKNWLFFDTVNGAKTGAFYYSLIESAKANNLNPRLYLKYLFDKFPFVKTEADLMALLPCNLTNAMIS